ncbi:unnamed protein product [Bursaphelenchus xylophilus]|uniref:Serine/threonine-protein phosphatase n=1 Tax=Bursaphelenchus xylophilus TaxID=6326 RepID=A0A1I7RNN1_BURXY|nr:unnamed protein product [Bursaphelenchus xylophilus]CAG9124173.1 unnamed protein product [Bursaphelenchus xylophilus]
MAQKPVENNKDPKQWSDGKIKSEDGKCPLENCSNGSSIDPKRSLPVQKEHLEGKSSNFPNILAGPRTPSNTSMVSSSPTSLPASLTPPDSPRTKEVPRHGAIKFDTAMLPLETPPPIPRAVTPFPFDIVDENAKASSTSGKNLHQPKLPEKATAGFNENVGPVISLRLRKTSRSKRTQAKSTVDPTRLDMKDFVDSHVEKNEEKPASKEIETVKLQSHRDAKENLESPLKEDAKNSPKLDLNNLITELMNSVTQDEKGNMVVEDRLKDPGIIEQIIVRAIESFKKLPSMLRLHAPLYIVGDIHGQFTDLLRIFALCGQPTKTVYLFLGDYVDRGPHSLEVICLLLLLRIRYPWNIHMLRGNHECSAVNRTYGFSDECESRFQHIPVTTTVWGVKATDMKGTQVWYRFQDVFNWLPFCALINERILCMHGGLSPNLERLEQLEALKRPIDPCEAGLPIDLLWADPDIKLPCGEEDPQYGPSNRGISSHFNVRAVMEACRNLGLDMIVRAHQVVQDGYEFFAQRHLVTLFSAPNYCGQYNNAGAIMSVNADLMITFKQLKPVSGTPCRKKVKSTEINFDDIDLDALCSEDEKKE